MGKKEIPQREESDSGVGYGVAKL